MSKGNKKPPAPRWQRRCKAPQIILMKTCYNKISAGVHVLSVDCMNTSFLFDE